MDALAASLLVLDAVSAALGLAVALFFLRAWRTSGDGRHLLFAIGLLLVGASFLTVTASEFDLGSPTGAWDALRLAGQTGGALVVLLTYVAAREDRPRSFLVLGGAAAILSAVAALVLIALPPAGELPSGPALFAVAHLVQTACWAGTATLAGRNWWRDPSASRFLVPAAFASFALSKYTWLILDLEQDERLAFLVYPWRLLALSLLLVALRGRPPREEPHAAP